MRRRRLLSLAATASLFSGCLSQSSPDTRPTTEPSNSPRSSQQQRSPTEPPGSTTTPRQRLRDCSPPPTETAVSTPSDGFRRLSVSGDPSPVDDLVDFTVTVRRQATTDAPATVAIHFTNRASVERKFQFTPVIPFTPESVQQVDGDGQLVLVPHQYESHGDIVDEPKAHGDRKEIPSEPTNGCWQATDTIGYVDYFSAIRLGPCERTSRIYSVLSSPGTNGCSPSGTYRTSTTWYIGDVVNEPEKTWGFTLTITER